VPSATADRTYRAAAGAMTGSIPVACHSSGRPMTHCHRTNPAVFIAGLAVPWQSVSFPGQASPVRPIPTVGLVDDWGSHEGGVMSKRYGRPSPHYRYEHYDPRIG
jgi:hypothetical protein